MAETVLAASVIARRDDEPNDAYRACVEYLRMPDNSRSLLAVHKLTGHPLRRVVDWSRKYDWGGRNRAFQANLVYAELEGRMGEARKLGEKWARRRLRAAEDAWENAELLAAKAKEMLASPLWDEVVESTDPETGAATKTTVKAPNWNLATAAAMFKLVAELQQQAVWDGRAAAADDDFNPETATPEEALAYLVRRGIKPAAALPAPAPRGEKGE